MNLTKYLILASFIGTNVSGTPIPTNYVEHEAQELHMRHLWDRRSKAERDLIVPVRIGMTQSNLDKGDKLLMEVYVLILSSPLWTLVLITCS
jgi:tripeptidyl-peptidase-1